MESRVMNIMAIFADGLKTVYIYKNIGKLSLTN